jgi:hypothetical protein
MIDTDFDTSRFDFVCDYDGLRLVMLKQASKPDCGSRSFISVACCKAHSELTLSLLSLYKGTLSKVRIFIFPPDRLITGAKCDVRTTSFRSFAFHGTPRSLWTVDYRSIAFGGNATLQYSQSTRRVKNKIKTVFTMHWVTCSSSSAVAVSLDL